MFDGKEPPPLSSPGYGLAIRLCAQGSVGALIHVLRLRRVVWTGNIQNTQSINYNVRHG